MFVLYIPQVLICVYPPHPPPQVLIRVYPPHPPPPQFDTNVRRNDCNSVIFYDRFYTNINKNTEQLMSGACFSDVTQLLIA